MSKFRPLAMALAAAATTVLLIPFSAGAAHGDGPPGAGAPPGTPAPPNVEPNVEPPGLPYGTCSVIDSLASSQDNACPEADKKFDDDEGDKFDEREKDEKSNFPFGDDDEDDDEKPSKKRGKGRD